MGGQVEGRSDGAEGWSSHPLGPKEQCYSFSMWHIDRHNPQGRPRQPLEGPEPSTPWSPINAPWR